LALKGKGTIFDFPEFLKRNLPMNNHMPEFFRKKEGRKIVIIGNGIAGITCARNIRKIDSSANIVLVSGESEYFFSRTALMYLYMGHMKYEDIKPYEDWFWEKNRIELIHAWVIKIDFELKKLMLNSGVNLSYDLLILATGSKPNKFGWPGQDLIGAQGLYSRQDLDLMEGNTKGIKHAVVVGGGLIGIEMAEMLSSRDIPVTFLVRETAFWDIVLPIEEAELVGRHIREHHIDLRLNTELKEIIDDGTGKVKAVVTDEGETIPCQFVGLATGVRPNICFLKNTALETNRGIVVNEFFATSIDGVFAIGDCAEFKMPPGPNRKEIEQVWYTGRMHGETLAYSLTVHPVPYRPGVWFNSAKFFDIEYQTYGTVPNVNKVGISSFYWEHEKGRICFRAVFETESNVFIGANALGFRLRHAFMDKAINERWKIDRVMEHLHQADFNPEFYQKNHYSILEEYNLEFGKNISSPKKGWFSHWWDRLLSGSKE
jgi:NADPH-dependent 2,4-dienoyl-CoA reductase/sulfur reductase-like enzyme